MFKNRFILVLGVVSLLLVTMAVSKPFSAAPTAKELSWPARPVIVRVAAANSATDFYQRHPDWTGTGNGQEAAIPVASSLDLSDYYLRHPELRVSTNPAIDTSDYYLRHPELSAPSGLMIDMMRFRTLNQNLSSSAKSTDLSDYFLRHPELIK
jgi:hypothetical protein